VSEGVENWPVDSSGIDEDRVYMPERGAPVFVRNRLLLLAISSLVSSMGDAVAGGTDGGAVTEGAEEGAVVRGTDGAPDDGTTGDDPEAVGRLGSEEFDIGKGALSELGVGKKLDPPVSVLSGTLTGAVYSGILSGAL